MIVRPAGSAQQGFVNQQRCGVVRVDGDKPDWRFDRCRILKVHDGDTIKVEIDLGFGIRKTEDFRLAGINAPELNTPAGQVAWHFLSDVLGNPQGNLVLVVYEQKEKYGRYLAWVYKGLSQGAASVNQLMIDSRNAAEWNGQGAKPLPPEGNA
jgi:endonuclease YncB( thermonuclease family)